MARLLERYNAEILPKIAASCGRANRLAAPRLDKIVISMGVGKAATAGEKDRIDEAAKHLALIAGQRPVVTLSKKAVSGFRLRENMKVGAKVTLRGKRMYEFLDRLVSLALPRVRDFRGVNGKSFDGHGNYSIGLTEQSIFPEIDTDKMKYSQGMNITFVLRNATDAEALELLKFFGMPFKHSN